MSTPILHHQKRMNYCQMDHQIASDSFHCENPILKLQNPTKLLTNDSPAALLDHVQFFAVLKNAEMHNFITFFSIHNYFLRMNY